MMVWKQIDGYRYAYRISEDGEVQRKMPDGKWIALTPWLSRGGGSGAGKYLFVKMAVNPAGHKRVPVVRLMEGRFIRPRRPGEVVSYRDGLAQNCARWNLYHTTHEELNKRLGGGLRRSVEKIDQAGNVLELYRSVDEAARANYLSRGCINRRCLGRVKEPFALTGYSFRYEVQVGRRRKGG